MNGGYPVVRIVAGYCVLVQYPSKLLEMPEGALVTIWEIAIFQSVFYFLNKAVAPFIFNELYRVPHLEYKRGLEKFCRSLAKAQFGNANLLEIS